MLNCGIVILNFNGATDTIQFIESILSASNKVEINNFICVVDNGSSIDDNKKLIDYKKKYNYDLLLQEENLGYAKACNNGIKFLQNKYQNFDLFILANNDLICDERFFMNLVTKDLRRKIYGPLILCWPNNDIIWSAGGKLNYRTGRGDHYYMGQNINNVNNLVSSKRNFLSGACLIIHNDVIKRVGLLPEEYYFGGEEWDYSYNAKKLGIELIFAPDLKVYHKVDLRFLHGNSHNYLNPKFVANGIIIKFVFMNRCSNIFWRSIWKVIYTIFIKFNYVYFPRKIKEIGKSYNTQVDYSLFKIAVKEALKFRNSVRYTKEDIEKISAVISKEDCIKR